MPSQAYYEIDGAGDWYAAVAATSPGQSPQTNPEKWVKLGILDIFEEYLVEQAVADLLAGEGQRDQRRAQRQTAQAVLEDLTWRHHVNRGDAVRPEVRTR